MKLATKAALSSICLMYIGVSFAWNKRTFRTISIQICSSVRH